MGEIFDKRIDIELTPEQIQEYGLEMLDWFMERNLLPQDAKRILTYVYTCIGEAINSTFGG